MFSQQHETLHAMINYYVLCPDNLVHVYYKVFYLFNSQLVCNMYCFVIKNFVKYLV